MILSLDVAVMVVPNDTSAWSHRTNHDEKPVSVWADSGQDKKLTARSKKR